MKTKKLQLNSPFKRALLYAVILLGSLTLSSNKSSACTASFTYSAGVNGHYTFTNTSVGFTSPWLYWNPGDGSGWQYGGSPFTHTYTANGTYFARLYASDSTCADSSAFVTITVTNVTTPCTLSASFNVSYGPGGQVTFTSTSAGTNANTLYYWAPGDSSQRYQEPSTYTHTYAVDGYYYVWLIVSDTGSAYCVDSIEQMITVRNAHCNISANFTYALDTNGQVTFTNTSTGISFFGGVYHWNYGDLTSDSTTSYSPFVHTYASDGTYTVTLVVSSDSSACSDTISIPVTITNACNLIVNFTYQYDSAGQVMFTSTSSGVNPGAQYGWSFGDATIINGYDTATHAYAFIGYYNVTLTVVNPGGCTLSTTQTIYIYNKDSLEASFVYASDSLAPSGTYIFTSTSLGTDAYTYYKWTPGDATPSDSGLGMTTYTHTYASNGPYSATLTIWYTVLPHSPIRHSPRYDLSSYTTTVNVTTVATGIQSLGDTKTYDVYPNPNNGSFRIAVNGLANEKNAEIRISNMMGQVIYQSNATVSGGNTLSDISLSNAANGVYLLQVITADNTYTSRIAIQK